MGEKNELEDILVRRYHKRRLVTFVESSDLKSKIVKNGVISSRMKAFMLGTVFGVVGIQLSEEEACQFLRKYIGKDTLVLTVPFSWADELSLAPGHPRKDTLYAAHPSDGRRYLPISEFHRLTFEDKFAEALYLLMHLGATEISVEHREGWERDFASELSVNIPGVQGEASVEGECSSNKKGLYHAKLDGHDEPSIPNDLVWYPHELTWQVVAEGRMDFGLKDFSLTLQYTDDYGIDADLAEDAQTTGFSLGGSFESHQSTVWEIKGTFKV